MKWVITGGRFPRAGQGLRCDACGESIPRGEQFLKAVLLTPFLDRPGFEPVLREKWQAAFCLECHRSRLWYRREVDLP